MLDRHTKILQTLAVNQNATVTELSQLYHVSEVTIRSDLNYLAGIGKIQRIHGGAVLLEERVRQEYNYQTRKNLNVDKKLKIGQLAAGMVNMREAILLDSSTTAVAVAQALNSRKEPAEITVITSGLWTAVELMASPNINVLITGGYLRHTSGSIVGIPAENMLKNLNLHKAFLGAWGISEKGEISDNHLLEVELKRYIVQNTEEIIILADGSKFDRSGLAGYANLDQISTIITDETAPADLVRIIKSQGVEVIIAE